MSARYAGYQALKIGQVGHVLTVTLDNPPMNGMTPEGHEELTRVWADIGADPAVRVVVFTGAGDRAFCAGGDPRKMVDNWGNRERWQVGMAEARAIIVGMLECPKPVIARINGHAMGLGASLALACDITVMVEDARIADSHVSVGLAAGDGGSLLWPSRAIRSWRRTAMLSAAAWPICSMRPRRISCSCARCAAASLPGSCCSAMPRAFRSSAMR